jgi:hypothetical protein
MHKNHIIKTLIILIITLIIGINIHTAFAEEIRTTNINKTNFNNDEVFIGFRIIRGTISNKTVGDTYLEFHAEKIINFNFTIFKGNPIPVISRETIEDRNFRIYQFGYYIGLIGNNFIFLIRNYSDSPQ